MRPFNHTHRSQSPAFFLPHLYHVMSQASSSEVLPISVGNLDLERDIGSIDDLISAFVAIVENSAASELYQVFNICSGRVKNLRKLAEVLLRS